MNQHEHFYTRQAKRDAITADLPYMTTKEIAEKYALSECTVAHYRKMACIPSPQIPLEKKVLFLHNRNLPFKNIASRLNTTCYRVIRILAKHGKAQYNKPKSKYEITPENCTPALYGIEGDTFQFEKIQTPENPNYGIECRERYEELKRWKIAKAKQIEAEILEKISIH